MIDIRTLNTIGQRVARGELVSFDEWWIWSSRVRGAREGRTSHKPRQHVMEMLRHPKAMKEEQHGRPEEAATGTEG